VFGNTVRVACQDSAHRYSEQAGVLAGASLERDPDHALSISIPVGDRVGLPDRSRIFGSTKNWASATIDARTSALSRDTVKEPDRRKQYLALG
jgi:hypothetical protein